MILRGFKEKSNIKRLNKLVSIRQVNINDSKVESLGVIMHIDEIDDFDLFRSLALGLNIRPKNLKVIGFSNGNKEVHNSWDMCFDPKDFGWGGRIKNAELQTFLNTEFDVLISYYAKGQLELKLLTVLSQAKFKIGVLQTDERLNDLIIKSNIFEFNVFKDELIKYLTILNKIKNEQ